MRFNWKKASAGTSLLLAAAALSAYIYTRANAPPTYHLANGVDVTPIDVQPDDTAKVLDIKVWKFDVVTPDPNHDYIFDVMLYRNGKPVESLGGAGSISIGGQRYNGRKTLFIGMAPVAGNFWEAHQVKAKYMIEQENGYASNTFANPITPGMELSDRPQSYDKGVCLMRGEKGYRDTGSTKDIAIVLTAEVFPITH